MSLRDAAVRPRVARAVTACAIGVALAAVAALAAAQQGSRLTDAPPPAASRWQAEIAQLDDAMRARLLVATDPRENWLAAKLDGGDPDAQVRRFAAARVARARQQAVPRDAGDGVHGAAAAAARRVRRDRPPRRLGDARRRQRRADAAAREPLAPAQQRDGDGGVPRGSGAAAAVRRLLEPGCARHLGGGARAAGRRGSGRARRARRVVRSGVRAVRGPRGWIPLCRDAQKAADAVRAACVDAGDGDCASAPPRGRCAWRARSWPSAARRRVPRRTRRSSSSPTCSGSPGSARRPAMRSRRRSRRPIAAVRATRRRAVGGAARAGCARRRSRRLRERRAQGLACRAGSGPRSRLVAALRRLHRRRRDHASGDAPASVRLPLHLVERDQHRVVGHHEAQRLDRRAVDHRAVEERLVARGRAAARSRRAPSAGSSPACRTARGCPAPRT